MAEYRFERECRTPHSEAFNVYTEAYDALGSEQIPIARIDLHYAPTVVHGCLNVVEKVTQDEISELISTIDRDLVMSADTGSEADDESGGFLVVVYQGREIQDLPSDDLTDEGEEDEDERG